MKILLVEDTVGEPIAKVVSRWGHEVVMATSAAEARLRLLEHDIDLMLVDWMLPGPSGIDLIRHVRATEGLERIPVIMISGRMQQPDIDAALASGVDSFLAKPFTAAQLRSRIDEVMTRWQQGQHLLPVVNGILALQERCPARGDSPVVLVAERAATRDGLLRAGESIVYPLANLVTAIEALNSRQSGLDLGLVLVDHSAGLAKTLQGRGMRSRVCLVVVSVEAGGTPVAGARLLAGREPEGMQLVVICDSPQELGLKTWYALEEAGVLVERRGLLNVDRWEELLRLSLDAREE